MSNAVGNRLSAGKCGSIFRQDHDKRCSECKFNRMFMEILFNDEILRNVDVERLYVRRTNSGPEVR